MAISCSSPGFCITLDPFGYELDDAGFWIELGQGTRSGLHPASAQRYGAKKARQSQVFVRVLAVTLILLAIATAVLIVL